MEERYKGGRGGGRGEGGGGGGRNEKVANLLMLKVGVREVLLNHEQPAADVEEHGIYWSMSVLLSTCIVQSGEATPHENCLHPGHYYTDQLVLF